MELAALEGAGEPGTERAIRRRDAETGGRDGALAAERRRDPDLQRGRGRVPDLATGTGRVRATGGRGAPRRCPDDRRQLGARERDGRQQPPALADDLAHGPGTHRGQLAPDVLGDGREVADDRVGRAGELGPQVLALGRDPGRTRVEMALARHVAADRDERRGPERELLGAEQRGDEQVAAGLEAAVGAQRDAVAQVVPEQDLVDLGQTELPRRADVLDRRQRRRPGPAGVAGQVDVRGAGLGDASRDGAHTAAGDELDADPCARVDRPQVGDQLGKILDRVDVVVRRRADVALAGLAATERGDVGRRLLAGQLAALARLRTLGDLDLELVGSGEVGGGHAEPCRGDLLDPGVVAAAVGGRGVPGGVFPTLAGVRGAARALDADRQRLVGLGAQGADAHRRHDEAADDVAGGFDLRERDGRRGGADAQLVARDGAVGRRARERGAVPSQGSLGVARGVDVGFGEFAVAGQDLDLAGDPRREEVGLAVGAEPGEPGVGQAGLAAGGRLGDGQRGGAAADLALGEVGEGRAPGPRGGGREAARDDRGIEIDDVDQRAADVRRDGADAHPGEGLAQAGLEGGDQAGDGVVRGDLLGAAGARELGRELDGEARLDGGRADGEDHGHRVDVEDVDGADRDVGPAAEAGGGQGGVDGTDREDRGDRQPIDRPAGVGDEHDRGVAAGRGDGVGGEAFERDLEPVPSPSHGCQVASSVRTVAPSARTAATSPSMSTMTGRARRTVRGPRGGPPSSAGRRPSSTRRSMTTRSRSGSIAGFVTWANAWRRWSATGRSSRARPGVGVSSPMLQSGSCASSAIVLMSRRARSASRPAR